MASNVALPPNIWQNGTAESTALLLEKALKSELHRFKAGHDEFRGARPYPHHVLDNLFPDALLDLVDDEFPDPTQPLGNAAACKIAAKERGHHWHCTAHGTGNGGNLKIGTPEEVGMGASTRALMRFFKRPSFVRHLEMLTGIGPLVVDETNVGAGLHQILHNGSLQLHADFNRHPSLMLERRVNVFLYLNSRWDTSWGGDLELWDKTLSTCSQSIAPHRNRLVVFASTDFSYHGHPAPLACPPHRSRRSIAIYYYTAGVRPEEEVNATARKKFPRTTLYRKGSCDGRCASSKEAAGFPFCPSGRR